MRSMLDGTRTFLPSTMRIAPLPTASIDKPATSCLPAAEAALWSKALERDLGQRGTRVAIVFPVAGNAPKSAEEPADDRESAGAREA